MAESSDTTGARQFFVIDVVATDPPKGLSGGAWHRYTIGDGSSPISGVRSGSLSDVRRYAEDFADDLNQRALRGNTVYAPRRTGKN